MKHGVRHERRRWLTSSAVTAGVAFLLSFLVFGGVLLLPLWLNRVEGPSPVEVDGAYGYERTVLVLVHDTDNTLTAAVAVSADTRTLTMRAVGYPACTEAVYRTRLCTLADFYAGEGAAAGDYLSSVSGTSFDGVWQLSISAVAALAAQLGNGVTYTLPEAVGTLPAGAQTLTSLQVADVLRFTGWTQQSTGQAAAHAGIIAALINQYLTPQQNLTAVFNTLTALCDERLTVSGFAAVENDLQRLAVANTGTLCSVSVPMGRTVGIGNERRYALAN